MLWADRKADKEEYCLLHDCTAEHMCAEQTMASKCFSMEKEPGRLVPEANEPFQMHKVSGPKSELGVKPTTFAPTTPRHPHSLLPATPTHPLHHLQPHYIPAPCGGRHDEQASYSVLHLRRPSLSWLAGTSCPQPGSNKKEHENYNF